LHRPRGTPTARRAERPPRLVPVILASALGLAAAHAGERGPGEFDPSWALTGAATIHYGYYDVAGDASSSPYPFTGSQPYGEIELSWEQRLTDGHALRAQLLAVVNDSDYRSDDDGFVPERLRVVIENPMFAIPYRAEFGDSYVFLSQRTAQRPLKGFRFELQSALGSPDRMQSLQFISAAYETNWKNIDFKDDLTTGFSWLVEDRSLGSLALTWLESTQRDQDESGDLRRRQRVGSIAAWAPLQLGSAALILEGEAAFMRQRITGVGADDEPFDGEAYFFQLSGHHDGPLHYRLRYEDSGENYAPVNAPIVSDRRAAEGHVSWRFDRGGELRGRVLSYRDLDSTDDPFDTTTIGVRYGGPLGGGVSGNIDAFIQELGNRSRSTDFDVTTVDAELARGFGRLFSPRLRLFWQDRRDQRSDAMLDDDGRLDERTFEARFEGGIGLRLGTLTGTIAPGIVARRIRGGSAASNDWQPTLDLRLGQGRHTMAVGAGLLSQGRRDATGVDIDTVDWNAFYRYQGDASSILIEYERERRQPEPGADTTSWRASAAYTYRFDALSRPDGARSTDLALGAPLAARADPSELQPGTPMAEVFERLRAAGFGEPEQLDRQWIYRTPVFQQIFQAQRLILIERDGQLERAAVVIVPEETGDPDRFDQEFERIRRAMIGRWGTPSDTYDEGEYGDDVWSAIRRGRAIRLTEWRRAGSLLRFGIPQRLDGQLLLELQVARRFPEPRDTRWSIDEFK